MPVISQDHTVIALCLVFDSLQFACILELDLWIVLLECFLDVRYFIISFLYPAHKVAGYYVIPTVP